MTTRATHRHVVLPPDIAKMLPKNRLLSEVRAETREGRGETLDGWGRTSGLPSPRLGLETKTPRTPTTRLTEDAR